METKGGWSQSYLEYVMIWSFPLNWTCDRRGACKATYSQDICAYTYISPVGLYLTKCRNLSTPCLPLVRTFCSMYFHVPVVFRVERWSGLMCFSVSKPRHIASDEWQNRAPVMGYVTISLSSPLWTLNKSTYPFVPSLHLHRQESVDSWPQILAKIVLVSWSILEPIAEKEKAASSLQCWRKSENETKFQRKFYQVTDEYQIRYGWIRGLKYLWI